MDVAAEIERLTAEQEKYTAMIERVDRQLANQQFITRAPREKVEAERQKRLDYQKLLTSTQERLRDLSTQQH